MPDPIPENRNVLGGQQQTAPQVVAPPVRPAQVRVAPAPVARRHVANPDTPPSWATVVLPQPVPGPWNEVTEPQPQPRSRQGRTPSRPSTRATTRPPAQAPATRRLSRPPLVTRQMAVPARRGSSGFGGFVRGMLLFTTVLLTSVWGATLAFPSLLQYAIIADTAQLAENVFFTLWGVVYATGMFALMVYTQRDAITSFVSANPLISMSAGVGGLLCLILLGLSIKGMRRRQ
jgi:hypothetical protein